VQQRYVVSGLFRDYKYQTPQTVATYLQPLVDKLAKEYQTCPTFWRSAATTGYF
jgi:hypothetical protein